jgi:uncharacterized membrane protein YgcG
MRALILMAASAVCLLGCTTPQQQAAKQQAEMDRMIAQYGPACTQLGFQMDTDPWRNCVVQLDAKNNANRGSISTSIFGGWGSSGGWGRSSGVGVGIGVGR